MCGLWDAAPALRMRSFLPREPLEARTESLFGQSAAFACTAVRYCTRKCRTAGAGATLRDGMVGIGDRSVYERPDLRADPPSLCAHDMPPRQRPSTSSVSFQPCPCGNPTPIPRIGRVERRRELSSLRVRIVSSVWPAEKPQVGGVGATTRRRATKP